MYDEGYTDCPEHYSHEGELVSCTAAKGSRDGDKPKGG